MMRHIAVIGGGLSGAIFCIAMLRQCDTQCTLHLIEPDAALGRGIAYGQASPWHSLNVTADRASLEPDNPDHLWQWAAIHGPGLGFPEAASADAKSYLPRKLFGLYAAASLQEAARHSAGPRLVVHQASVQRLLKQDQGFRLQLSDGSHLDCGEAVLLTGALPGPALDLPGLQAARNLGHVVDNPWDIDRLRRIGKQDRVVIAGTGLTMADVVLSLRRVGHRGEIVALSRHGVVPAPRSLASPGAPVLQAGDAPRLSHLLHRLRQAVRRNPGGDWQQVFESLRSVTRDLWQNMDTQTRRRFARHCRTFWDAHRFRMPPDTAQDLQADLQAGRLRLLKARFMQIAAGSGALDIAYRRRGASNVESLACGALILCTGPGQNPAQADFLQQSRQDGLIRLDASGMGLDATQDGQLLDAAGRPVPGLYAFGPPLRGLRLECTAITEIRGEAFDLARLLAPAVT